MLGINGAELIILVVLAVLILGPEKLPEYARSLTNWIRRLREMSEGAKAQFKEETGTDFDDVDWRRYDPRQYDPRRIIREALAEPTEQMRSAARDVWDHEEVQQDLRGMDPRDLVRSRARSAGTGAVAATSGGAVPTAAEEVATSDADSTAGAGLPERYHLESAGQAEETVAEFSEAETEEAWTPVPAPYDVEAT